MSDNTDVVRAIERMTERLEKAILKPRHIVKDNKGRPVASKPGMPYEYRTEEDDEAGDISHR